MKICFFVDTMLNLLILWMNEFKSEISDNKSKAILP